MPSRTATPVAVTNEQIVSAATGRWGEVAAELKPADPYVLTKADGTTITISPLTRRRRKALKAAQAAYLMVGAKLAEAQEENTADQGTISRINATLDEAERAYDEALFGGKEVTDEITEYFDDLQEEFWDAFYQDVHDALVNRVTPPEGVCPRCGQEIEGAATEDGEGKDSSSSTSSTDTGTKSKATSATS